ncbi:MULTISPECIES: DUF6207 family protein [Streptomyces]|uniref:DUF6207 family protein n=1 Tax=Streptomyces TaxID=1883 RepID=UPI0033B135FE
MSINADYRAQSHSLARSFIWVAHTLAANRNRGRGVAPGMDSFIDVRHVSEPGLVVLDITAADEETALALMDGLQQLWATSGIATIRRDPAQPGVRARVHADIRRTNPGGEVGLLRHMEKHAAE